MTGFVFKIHANMDPNHRDRIAFLKICSGTFERNRNYLHVRSGKQLKFSSPTAFMAEKKSVIDFAYPGDIVGLHDTGNFKIGDTFTEGEKLRFTGIPSFAPEQFRYIENADPLKFKQLAKGIDQLMDEGVAQLFTSSLNGRKIIGTVGALQFEVIQYRLEHEYSAACRWEPISIYKACWIDSSWPTSNAANTPTWPSTNTAATYSSPTRATGSPWHRRISKTSASISPRSSKTQKIRRSADSGGFASNETVQTSIGTSIISSLASSEALIRKSSAFSIPMPSRGPSSSPATSARPSTTKT